MRPLSLPPFRARLTGLALACVVASVPFSWVVAASGPTSQRSDARGGKPFGVEQAVTLRSFTDLCWSADGDRLAFVLQTPDTSENTLQSDVYLYDRRRPGVLRLTRHPSPDISPTFSPSGDTIAFVSTRGAGSDARPTIAMLSLRGGDPWTFGGYDESVGEVHWSPDGRMLAYVKTDTLPSAIREWRKRKWDQVVEDERLQYPQLWVVDVATGKQRRLVGGARYVWYVRWSPDSRRLAFLVSPTGAADDYDLHDIGVVDVVTGTLRWLGAIGAPFEWSPDSRWIAWSSSEHRNVYVEKSDLWVSDAHGGRPVKLTAGFDADPGTPVWNRSSDTLFFHVASGVTTVLGAVARTGGPVRVLVDRNGGASQLTIGPGGRAAWVESHPTSAEEIVVADHPALPGHPITSVNADVARCAFGETRTVQWTSTDGVRVEGVLVGPPGATRKPLPTIVLLHGSPYGSRFDLAFQPKARYFAEGGYQVFMPNFRASGGYGTSFMVRKRADWGGQDWQDVSSGIDSLVARRLADPHRLAIVGGSYGGYLSAWAITQTDRFDAACVERGIVDLPALWGQSDVRKYRAFEFGGRPWETFDTWRAHSPITHVERVRTPTLILDGENDRRTPFAQSLELYRSLQALGVPTQLVRYPREGHVLREPRHIEDLLVRDRAWFDRWVR